MNDLFCGLFSRQPEKVICGDYYYDTDSDGDQFIEDDRDFWLGGRFRDNWRYKQHESPLHAEIFNEVRRLFSDVSAPFLEIACGPGMGLAPIILGSNPKLGCLATDACSILIESWREYINMNLRDLSISLAQFSVMDIPLVDGAFENVTSYIGVSSTRAGKEGQLKALKEIRRVLKDGGRFVAIESDGWADIEAVKKVYASWAPPLWKPYDVEHTKRNKGQPIIRQMALFPYTIINSLVMRILETTKEEILWSSVLLVICSINGNLPNRFIYLF